MHHDFLGSEGLQGTHMDALNPFNSKLMTLTPKGRFVNLFGDFSPLYGLPFQANRQLQIGLKKRTLGKMFFVFLALHSEINHFSHSAYIVRLYKIFMNMQHT